MSSIKTAQQEAMASIDTAKALTDKVLSILTIMLESPSLSLTFATNPIGFLLQILEHLGVKYEDLQKFLTRILIWVVPALEISVKAILLSNLKNMASCSIDPRIPEKYRKTHKSPGDYNTVNEYGIDINIESIDMLDKLSVNPLSDAGKDMYFGLKNIEDVYKFVRADDFDAFLWFVIHKGKFPMASEMSTDLHEFNDRVHGVGNFHIAEDNPSLFKELNITPDAEEDASNILPGNTFRYKDANGPNIVSICIDAMRDEENNIIHNTLVPVSDDWASVNWYVRRASELGKNIGFGWKYDNDSGTVSAKKSRNYSKERAICNLQYMGAVDDAPLTGLVNNKIRFTILPKPYIHVPDTGKGEPPWRFKKLLFDADGNYDPNGRLTFHTGVTESIGDKEVTFNSSDGPLCTLDLKSGLIKNTNKENILKNLVECYKGLTVYEFNYDYVMGIKLFDAKTLVTTLLDTLVNLRVGVSTKLSRRHQEETEKLREIIKSIINTDDSTVENCYFTFDNSKYDDLLKKTQEKKARQQKFGNITRETGVFDSVHEILAEYDTKTDLNEQMDVLHRAIQQVAATISEGSNEEDRQTIQYNFVFDLIENLVFAIVEAILSPKVMMLLEVNQKIMGGTWEKLTTTDFLIVMGGVIRAIISEVRDLILQELLKFTLDQLEPIYQAFLGIIARERLEDIADAMQSIIRDCPVMWFNFGNQNIETKLDTVDYADIDVSSNKEGEKPSSNKC